MQDQSGFLPLPPKASTPVQMLSPKQAYTKYDDEDASQISTPNSTYGPVFDFERIRSKI